jgi:hypothetical protein
VNAETVTDVSLEELLGDDSAHLACGCRPPILLCGRYMPDMEGVDLLAPDETICKGCMAVWYANGCPACSCGPGAICGACIASASQGRK